MKVRCILGICLVLTAAGWAQTASDETEYFALFMEGKKVGYAIQNRVVAEGKVTTTEQVSLTISRLNMPVTMNTTETSIETIDGKPLAFEALQDFSMMMIKITGKVNKNGKVDITVTSMGAEQKSTIEWPNGAVMAEGLRLLQLKRGLKQGQTYTAKVFSAAIMQAVDIKTTIAEKKNIDLLGRVVALTEVHTTMKMLDAGEIASTGYVDDNFRLQKNIMSVMGMRVEMVACEKAFALGQNDVLDVVDKMFLASPVPLDNVRSAKSIRYYLRPTSETDTLPIPSGDNQKVRRLKGGRVIVIVRPVTAPKGVRFPYNGRDKTLLEATRPTRFLQSDRKEIIKLARRAIGDTKDAAEAVKRIEAFVAGYIENKNLSVGYATAAEVAASRQGDCTEFAVLTAAMCRAVGIPAQIVMGLAYVDEYSDLRDRFGGHAWVQAYIGNKWVGLDSAFKSTGRGGYDAGHIALAVGDGAPEDFFNLVSTLGQFKLDRAIVNKN